MTVYSGATEGSDYIDIRSYVPVYPENANAAHGLGGNDTILGSAYADLLTGGEGNDLIYGYNGNDILVGDNGNDTLYGGNGNDSVLSGAGDDHLLGGAGNDLMYGGTGNDIYYHYASEGVDTINDDKSEAGNTGYGGGTSDIVYFANVNLANLGWAQPVGSNDLWLGTTADLSDGVLSDGVVIQDFFLGGNNLVEWLVTADNYSVNLASLL